MKNLKDIIIERLHITKPTGLQTYKYFPKTREELREILKERLAKDKDVDLNDINVSEITNMGADTHNIGLFEELDPHDIDISNWDVSNVEDMSCMFWTCPNLNCDLSKWDVSNVKKMNSMFFHCEDFNSDLSHWNVSNVTDMSYMFDNCKNFNCDLSNWDVSSVEKMYSMFSKCENFNCDLSSWNVSKVSNMVDMFYRCSNLKNKPSWYKY